MMHKLKILRTTVEFTGLVYPAMFLGLGLLGDL